MENPIEKVREEKDSQQLEIDLEGVKRERAVVFSELSNIENRLHELRVILKHWADPGDKEAFDRALGGVVTLMGRVQDTNVERPREWSDNPDFKDWKWE